MKNQIKFYDPQKQWLFKSNAGKMQPNNNKDLTQTNAPHISQFLILLLSWSTCDTFYYAVNVFHGILF